MPPIYFDTETCGLHGPIVLIQWAEGDGEINLHEVWTTPIKETIDLIEKITNHPDGVIAFNLAFDWFHICQLYTTLIQFPDYNEYPEDHISEYAKLEATGRDGPCLKPHKCFDVMLHARKGPYQSTMERGDIRIKKVPAALAYPLAQELEKRVKLKPIYFARRKNKYTPQWNVYDIEDTIDFKDIVLKFNPSNALKALAVDALGVRNDDLILYGDVDVGKEYWPKEYGYAPFALAVGKPGYWNDAWPDKIHFYISHWAMNQRARKYAANDIIYTRDLYKFFNCPEMGDDDSELAALIGAARWKGYKVDIDKIKQLRSEALTKVARVPTAPKQVRAYIYQHLSETERTVLQEGTKLNETTGKIVLEEVAKFTLDCPDCNRAQRTESELIAEINGETITSRCATCNNIGKVPHPAAKKAQEVLEARQAKYEVDFYNKLILAGRLHASFVVIGTLSSRMSGSDGLNPQGIKKSNNVRSAFPLAYDGYNLCGGDFKAFEVVIADAIYGDPDLRRELMEGKKIHALFGQYVYPGMSYEDILATDGTENDLYTRSKSAVFAMLYGGEAFTLKERLGVDIEAAERAYQLFTNKYRKVGEERRKIINMFCSMRQKETHGKVEWNEPADKIESMFGFPRYFTLENQICKALFDLAEKPPENWKSLKVKVIRRDRQQTAVGALQSALFAAAFAIQGSNTRAAQNHVIQSTGAQITKKLQRRIWEIQPAGINKWIVQPMNIHDEVLVPTLPSHVDAVKNVVDSTVESMRPLVPLIGIDWGTDLSSWAAKKAK